MARGDLEVAVPPTWRRRSDPARGVLVAARATVLPASGVRPELTLTCATVDRDLESWRAEAMRELAARLDDFALEDEDTYDLEGHDVAYRRFAHRLGAADVLCDQWAWVAGGVGVTLTCSVAREDYGDYCDVFEAIAATVDLGPLAA
ncbi:MAG: hypothetical protein Q8O61_00210 [Nocardioides sp.]|nr:hypothetical protein [Nocardioides sp.]